MRETVNKLESRLIFLITDINILLLNINLLLLESIKIILNLNIVNLSIANFLNTICNFSVELIETKQLSSSNCIIFLLL